MRLPFNRPLATALLLACTLLVWPSPSRAQFAYNPRAAYVAGRTQGAANATAVAARTAPFRYGYGYAPWGYGYAGPGTNPYYGYMAGAAEITTANAQYQQTIQQARVTREQARQASWDTRRKAFDERRYEEANTPTPEDVRQKELAERIRHSRNNPAPSEIWSGAALNTLLLAVQHNQTTQGLKGPLVPLEDGSLKRINVTNGTMHGSVGVLKDGGRLQWPLVLRQERFAREREQIDRLAPAAVRGTASGSADDKTLEDLLQATKALKQSISDAVQDLSPTDYIKAMRYANEIYKAVRILPEEGSANYLTGKWQAKGRSVGELVDDMTRNGLKFAPAGQGDEAAYTALYQNLLAYDAGLSRIASAGLATADPGQPMR